MKNYIFPAAIIASLFVIYGFTANGNNYSYSRLPENILFANEILKDFRIPSEGYYPEFIRNLKKNSQTQDKKTSEKDIDRNWYAQVTENIKKDEYNISFCKELNAYQSPNRANNFRFVYNKDGFSVSPRTTKIPLFDINDKNISEKDRKYKMLPDWKIEFVLTGYGKDGSFNKFNGSNITADKNSAYSEDSNMKITYLNAEKGMRQDFIVKKRPEGNENSISLSFKIDTKLKTEITENGILFFNNRNEKVLQYSSLNVTDASGKHLNAYFKKQGSKKYKIIVEDGNAVYPVTIDPLSTSPDWTAESDQASARFGWSVSTAGDVNGDGYSDVIVGAVYYDNGQTDEGRAFVYYGSASGLSLTPNWTAESDQTNANFGGRVSTAGDVNGDGYSDVIVGAYDYDNGQTNEGRVFVYYGSSSGLSLTANWTAECDQANASFGYSVSTAGDVNGDGYSDVIVGAYRYDNGQTDEGRAFVYYGSASGLSLTPNWTAESDQVDAYFGISVSTAGDVNGDGYSDVIVGAQGYDYGYTDEGMAYVYYGSSSGLSLTPNWTAVSNKTSASFGFSVSTAGDVNGDGYSDVIVGAPYYSNGGNQEGLAVVYYGSASGLSITANWWAESNQSYAYFGFSVSTAGDVNGDGYSDVIVGAYMYDNGHPDEGWAFVYYGSASGLSITANWMAESNQSYAYFGCSVSTAGDVNGDGYSDVIVGANNYANGQNQEGRAFVYYGSASGLSITANWTAESDQANAQFGYSVSTAGDVNGDGYSDVIVGAYMYDNGQTDEGRTFVYHGSSSGLSLTPNWTAESDQESAQFGWSVSTAGDVNGDGYSDVIVGAYVYSNGETFEGRAFVYYGSASGLSTTPNWSAESNQADANFGFSVSTAGDVNGDGYSDVIVGAYCYSNGEAFEGRAFVYHGSSSGLSLTPNWTAESDQASARFGGSVSLAGDVNGDGYSDVIVGAYGYDNGQTDEGRAFVYYGSSSGLSLTANWTAESNQADANFGGSVSTAGDVNGDGYSDVIVGASGYDNGQTNEGRAFVYHGSTSGLSLTPNWTAESDQASARFGGSVSIAGDVNGDGYSDVIVGAYLYDNGQTNEGRAFVYHGSSSGLSLTPNWTAESDQATAYFGISVSTAGDVNGDGYSDVIVGAYMYDNGQTDEGRAFVYYGNGGTSILSRPRQFRNDKYTPIVPALKTRSTSDMVIGLVPITYFCRGLAKLQVEVKQLGTAFNNSNMNITQNWYAIGLYSNEIKIHVTGLQDKTIYKWRARLMYDMTDGTPQRYSRWFYGPGGRGLACFQVSNDDYPLPVQLRSFTGEAKINNILLGWVTVKEYNNAGFQVEGMKADAYSTNWESRGFVQSVGNTNEPMEYKFEDRNKSHGVYLYRLKQIDLNGNYHYYYLNSSISIGVPGKFELSQNYPNPFNPTTKITFALPSDSRVTLKIHDITGREVKTLINSEVMTADWYTREFNSSGLASGVYFYRLIADGINKYSAVKKMVLIK